MNELRSFLQWRVKSSRQPGSLRTLESVQSKQSKNPQKNLFRNTWTIHRLRLLCEENLVTRVRPRKSPERRLVLLHLHEHTQPLQGFNTATGHKQELGHDYKAGLIWSKSSKSNWRGREWTNAPVQTEQKLSIQRSYSYTNTCYNVVFLWS